MPYLVEKTGFWVDILGSVAHYRADPCLSQQVPQSERLIGHPEPCGPCSEPILGPQSLDLAQKTGSRSISGVPCLPTVWNLAYRSRFRTMNVPLGFLNPAGPVQNLSWVRKVLIWYKEQGQRQYLGFRSPLQCGTLLIEAGSAECTSY